MERLPVDWLQEKPMGEARIGGIELGASTAPASFEDVGPRVVLG
jgi:hypothetical protein